MEKRFGDIAEFINGRAFKPEDWGTNGLPIIRIQNLTGTNANYNYYEGEFDKRYLVKNDDLLISWSASLGVYRWEKQDAVLNQHIFKVNLKNGIDKTFFYYAVQEKLIEMGEQVHGSTMKHITKDRFDNLKISVPELKTQKKIGVTLSQADAARQKRKQANQLTEQFLQSTFIEMFGDPVKNEKGWEVKRIGDMGVVKTGNTPPRVKKEFYGDFIEWIKTDNIVPGFMYPSKSKEYLSEKGLSVGRFVEKDSIMVTCIAGSPTTIGNAVLTERKVSFNQQINSLTPSSDYNPIFVYGLFKQCKKIIQESTTKGMKRIITKSVFENIKFISPPLPLQKKFATLVAQVEQLRTKQRESEKELENLFQSLMQKYFG